MSLASLLLAAAVSASPPTCLPLEPHVVSLTGTLVNPVFPGPPNYESIERGDAREEYFYVKLDKPVCTLAKGDGLDFDHANVGVSLVQLFFGQNQVMFDRFRPYLNKVVSCSGSLWNRQTGHHHGDIMLTVSSCVPLSNQPLHPTTSGGLTAAVVAGERRR